MRFFQDCSIVNIIFEFIVFFYRSRDLIPRCINSKLLLPSSNPLKIIICCSDNSAVPHIMKILYLKVWEHPGRGHLSSRARGCTSSMCTFLQHLSLFKSKHNRHCHNRHCVITSSTISAYIRLLPFDARLTCDMKYTLKNASEQRSVLDSRGGRCCISSGLNVHSARTTTNTCELRPRVLFLPPYFRTPVHNLQTYTNVRHRYNHRFVIRRIEGIPMIEGPMISRFPSSRMTSTFFRRIDTSSSL